MKKYLVVSGCIAIAAIALSACNADKIPAGANAVQPFDVQRYLGKWHEIARLDFRFEKNMIRTTANYSLNKDGSIAVVNRGYDTVKKTWKQADGKAKFRGSKTEGKLKVSFFGPFYGAYNVIALDEDYQYALVAGENLDYLWILSRETTIPETIRQQYVETARGIGYKVDELVWVAHD